MKVGFIGGGNMGEAMIAALCKAGGRDCAASGENFTEDKENCAVSGENCAHDGQNFMPDTQSFAACGQNSANLKQNFASCKRDFACAQPTSDTKFQVLAYARSKNEALRRRYGVQILQDETQLAHAADIIVLATKPASYEGILRLIAPELAGKILLLLAPNFKLERAQNIVDADVFVARAMPNVAANIGASATASILMRPVGRSCER